jgi:5-methylcytosine-specific restriction endonuclease McrA
MRICLTCVRPFTPTLYNQRRCPAHEPRGRASRSPTTRAQDATYVRERRRVLAPGALCHWCGNPATTVDHVRPVAKGGGHAGNLVPACVSCNSSRQARTDWTP